MFRKSERSVKKNIGRKMLLAAVAASALVSGFAATPALADRWHGDHYRHERWDHRRHYRPHAYWAPGYYGPPPVVYAPPAYYAPPPPPPVYYGPPSLNVVIPIR
ncbi:MAG TPA: hypothetical protein VGN05_04375 [Parvibaculum sp.]